MEQKGYLILTLIFVAIAVVSGIIGFAFTSCPGYFDAENPSCIMMIVWLILFAVGFIGALATVRWWAHKKRWGEL